MPEPRRPAGADGALLGGELRSLWAAMQDLKASAERARAGEIPHPKMLPAPPGPAGS